MKQLKLVGTHYEIGQTLAISFKKRKSKFPISLDKWQMDRGVKSLKILENLSPEIIEEIKGISDTNHYDYNTFGAWLMSMGCCLTITRVRFKKL